jgi:predicted RNA-binding Zn-ribbon protein involved in translation (DUF1610 family)
MNETIDTEVVHPSVPSTMAVATRPEMGVAQAMSIKDIIAQVKLVQDVMREVMHEGEHYGTIPGCGDKKTLLQPGAQKLTMTFRLAPSYEIQEVNLPGGHKEYRVICTLKTIGSQTPIGQGVGCCSSMESKYRWHKSERKCPNCGKENIRKSKQGDGWYCWVKTDGCGATFPAGDASIESQEVGRAENPDPADTFNTVLKIAKKRAFVDATITATAASDIFTQDIGDDEEPTGGWEKPPESPKARSGGSTPQPTRQKPAQRQPAKQAPPANAPSGGPAAPAETVYERIFIDEVREATSAPDAPKQWHAFFVKFNDGEGMTMEAGTFDTKLGELARRADKNDIFRLVTRPGKKEGKTEIVSLEKVSGDIVP